ncbi:MAG: cupredoxin domain-containing protein, partial [Pseudonocardiales bacterium]
MTTVDLFVIVGAAIVAAGLAWFFFGGRRATQRAQRTEDFQQVSVIVRGGYTPARIEAVAGLPLRITFDRRESGDCSSRVVFPDLGINRALPANAKTDVEVVPDRVGEFAFSCAMNMIHGSLIVTPASSETPVVVPVPAAASSSQIPDPAAEEAREAEARHVEVRDLTRRVVAASLFTLPVLFAVMAHD